MTKELSLESGQWLLDGTGEVRFSPDSVGYIAIYSIDSVQQMRIDITQAALVFHGTPVPEPNVPEVALGTLAALFLMRKKVGASVE